MNAVCVCACVSLSGRRGPAAAAQLVVGLALTRAHTDTCITTTLKLTILNDKHVATHTHTLRLRAVSNRPRGVDLLRRPTARQGDATHTPQHHTPCRLDTAQTSQQKALAQPRRPWQQLRRPSSRPKPPSPRCTSLHERARPAPSSPSALRRLRAPREPHKHDGHVVPAPAPQALVHNGLADLQRGCLATGAAASTGHTRPRSVSPPRMTSSAKFMQSAFSITSQIP